MEQINNLINFFKNTEENVFIDIILAVIIVILSIMISSFISFLIMKIFRLKEKDEIKLKKHPLYKSIKSIVFYIGVYIAVLVLKLPEEVQNVVSLIIRILIIWSIARTVASLIAPDSKLIKRIKASKRVDEVDVLVNTLSRFGKAGVYIIAVIVIIAELDIDISGLITGLGLTSVVIALAAQDLAESLLSGAAIISDKPFLVGDYIKVGSFEGTVTEIKFRCTRIKAVDDTIVTVQNSTITSSEIVNYSRMTKRRLDVTLNLPLETKSKDIENTIVMLKSVLEADDEVIDDSVRVYFDGIADESIQIKIYLYTRVVAYDDFLEFKTKMHLLIIKALEMDNVKISYPGENVYLQR